MSANKETPPPASQPDWIWKVAEQIHFMYSCRESARFVNIAEIDLLIRHRRPKPPDPTTFEPFKTLIKEWNEEFNDPNWNGLYRNALASCIIGLEKVLKERGDVKCATQPTVAVQSAQLLMASQAAEVTKAASSPEPRAGVCPNCGKTIKLGEYPLATRNKVC